MEANGAGHNGSGDPANEAAREAARQAAKDRRAEEAPERVRDLAEACVRFVERALGVKLDYEPETLPLLDHYLATARAEAEDQPAARVLVAHAAGAYFGEVVRRRYPSWWRAEGNDPGGWRIELENVYLSFSPVELVADALFARATSRPASAWSWKRRTARPWPPGSPSCRPWARTSSTRRPRGSR